MIIIAFEFVMPSEGQDYAYLPLTKALTRLGGEIQVRTIIWVQHYSYCNLKINGLPLPCSTLQPNFDKDKCIREYRHFLDNIDVQHEMETNNLGWADYKFNTRLFYMI
jgi:hypothetical protein